MRHMKSIVLLLIALASLTRAAVAADTLAPVRFDARTARSGNWSDPATWENGRVPKAGDFVQVRAGQVIVYDVAADADVQALRMVHVAGTLTFARDRSTRLDVGLLKIQPGEEASEDGFVCSVHSSADESLPAAPRLPASLEVGTADDPIPAGVTATIRLVHFDRTDKDSLPAIIDCGGRMDFHRRTDEPHLG